MTLIRSYCKPPVNSAEVTQEITIPQLDLPIMEKFVDEWDNPIKTILTLRLVNKGFGNSLTLLSLIGSGRRFHVRDEEAAAFFFDNKLEQWFHSVRFGQRVFESGFKTLSERIVQREQIRFFDISLTGCSAGPYFSQFLKSDPISYNRLCKSLKGLSLSGSLTVTDFYNLLVRTTSLVALDLTNIRLNLSSRSPQILGDNGLSQMFAHLKKINLSGVSVRVSDRVGILLSINDLQELIIRSFDEFNLLIQTLRESGMLAKVFGGLRKLDIQASILSAENLRDILQHMTSLEEINLCRVKFNRFSSLSNDVHFLEERCWPNLAHLKRVDMRGLLLSSHDQLHINDFFSPLQRLVGSRHNLFLEGNTGA